MPEAGGRAALALRILGILGLAVFLAVTHLCNSPVRAEDRPGVPSVQTLAPSPPRDLDTFLDRMSALPGFCSDFEEEKTLSLLDAPLRSRGRIVFAQPNRLLRRVTEPLESDVVLDGDSVEIRTGSQIQQIDLSTQTGLEPLVRSVLWILAGDREAIARTYHATFESRESGWSLRLTPRDPRLATLISEMRLEGVGGLPTRLVLVETTGDRTQTRFIDPEIGCPLSEVDRARFFAPTPR